MTAAQICSEMCMEWNFYNVISNWDLDSVLKTSFLPDWQLLANFLTYNFIWKCWLQSRLKIKILSEIEETLQRYKNILPF